MEWQWEPYQRRAFQQLKETLCTKPILLFPYPKLPYTIVTDAFGTVLGGDLMQDQGDGLQPLVFLSRRLKSTEQRYNAYERELVVVAYSLQSQQHSLEGCLGGVTMVTDHQPLVRIMGQQVLTRVQTRWLRLGFFQSICPLPSSISLGKQMQLPTLSVGVNARLKRAQWMIQQQQQQGRSGTDFSTECRKRAVNC